MMLEDALLDAARTIYAQEARITHMVVHPRFYALAQRATAHGIAREAIRLRLSTGPNTARARRRLARARRIVKDSLGGGRILSRDFLEPLLRRLGEDWPGAR